VTGAHLPAPAARRRIRGGSTGDIVSRYETGEKEPAEATAWMRSIMSDESILVFVLLLGLAVMIVGLVRYQRGKERRIAARAEIEIPIESTA
jgi:hypothetical protein